MSNKKTFYPSDKRILATGKSPYPDSEKNIKIFNRHAKINGIFEEAFTEISKAEEKHGNQDHLPSLDQTLLKRKGSCSSQRMCDEYNIAAEYTAKNNCNVAFKRGELTHAHILIEEISEAVCCLEDEKEMRKELIQVIAMATNWILSIDNNHKKYKNE